VPEGGLVHTVGWVARGVLLTLKSPEEGGSVVLEGPRMEAGEGSGEVDRWVSGAVGFLGQYLGDVGFVNTWEVVTIGWSAGTAQ